MLRRLVVAACALALSVPFAADAASTAEPAWVKPVPGAVVRSSIANTARLDRDTYSAGQRVVAWFTPDDCVVLER